MGQTPTPGRIVLVRVDPATNAGAEELPGIITAVDKDKDDTVSVSVFAPSGAITPLTDVVLYDTRDALDEGLAEHVKLLPPRPSADAWRGPYGPVDVLPWVNAARWPSVPSSAPAPAAAAPADPTPAPAPAGV